MPWPSGPVVVSMPVAWPYSGMAGGLGAELAELLKILDRHVRVAGEVEHRIEKHRAVAGRKDEAVAVRPVRLLRIEPQIFGEENRCDVRHAHRHAGVTGIGLLDGIHGKESDRVGHPVVLFARDHGSIRSSEFGWAITTAAGRTTGERLPDRRRRSSPIPGGLRRLTHSSCGAQVNKCRAVLKVTSAFLWHSAARRNRIARALAKSRPLPSSTV